MKKRSLICLGLALVFGLGTLTACGGEQTPPQGDNGSQDLPNDTEKGDETQVKDLKPIVYENSKNAMRTGSNVNLVIPPAAEAVTGRQLTAYVMLDTYLDNYNYYIVDWGDGTWSYNGPYAYNETYQVLGEVYHTYKKGGTYNIRAAGVNLALGELYGWTEPQTLTVTGSDYEGELIKEATAISSDNYSEEYAAEKIADGENTFWQSKEAASPVDEAYVGYMFDGYYTLDTLEVKIPAEATVFPSNISVDYTTDGGESWFPLPHYYYVIGGSEGYNCIMNFPNPKGATLVLPLDKIVANGVRIRSVMYPLAAAGARTFRVAELRAYGTRDTLLYTSKGGSYDADLNNFWTIYGTAKTEPRMYNSLRGGATNNDPFRSGMTMIASVEWAEWNGDKLNWSGYDEALNIHVNSLKNARYGGDGWYKAADGTYKIDESEYNDYSPSSDGFIFATESGGKGGAMHLASHPNAGANHYTNNSTLILASRDYLLSGNGTEGFLQSQNACGQVMLDKLRKAATYMLETLDGKSGVMTIFDPRNDASVDGKASNYWDSLAFFGYQSSYENILFYRALLAMADIETYLGETANADYYKTCARTVKKAFNETFWDEEKGRYICSINAAGERLDFGFTPLNFMAASCGLADEERLKAIYDWVDGNRIIEGDRSTGEDIYAFKVSARSNTFAIDDKTGIGADGTVKHYWTYNGTDNDVLPGMWGEYGNQMQNGGTIFYSSHYDVLGRIRMDADNAAKRFDTILEEFHKDELRRNPQTKFGGYLVSILGEFPESGLVPLTFVDGFLGIEPDVKGLKISPSLPTEYDYAGVNEYHFGGRVYAIEVNRALREVQVTKDGEKWCVKLPADRTYYITLQNKLIEE